MTKKHRNLIDLPQYQAIFRQIRNTLLSRAKTTIKTLIARECIRDFLKKFYSFRESRCSDFTYLEAKTDPPLPLKHCINGLLNMFLTWINCTMSYI